MIIRERGSIECANTVQAAFNEIDNLIETDQTEVLEEQLRLCTPISAENHQHTAGLVYGLANTISAFIYRNK